MVCTCTRIRFGLVLIHQRVSRDELRQCEHIFTVLFPKLFQVTDTFLLSAVAEFKIRCFTDEGEVHRRARLKEEKGFNFQMNNEVSYTETTILSDFLKDLTLTSVKVYL